MRKVFSLLLAVALVHGEVPGLDQDDECAEAQGACALNALQVKSSEGQGADQELSAGTNDSETMSIASELNQTGNLWRLYHLTGRSIGPRILKEGFRAGHAGWCGGAIYFGNSPGECYHKAVGAESHQGYMIEAMVDVGRVKRMPWNCYTSIRCIQTHPSFQGHINCLSRHNYGHEVHHSGFQSIVFNPGDGNEIVIWDPSQVKSMRHIGSR
mmetsp:Transcript_7553/g.17380  ORF Transcript_7553/g.17380 Transcript_7553/m.17380 type:complete len:212 (-) Transcript_7553:123-758(-)